MTQLDEAVPNKRIGFDDTDRARGRASNSRRNQIAFAILTLVLAGIWLVILPWIARQPQMATHLQWLEEQGIDGGAMFYTELEAMEPILERLERRP
ncbi:MAG: hypothetical protein R3C09_08970 [Pirellulaceae bacterium]|jgi:hypothetical protein